MTATTSARSLPLLLVLAVLGASLAAVALTAAPAGAAGQTGVTASGVVDRTSGGHARHRGVARRQADRKRAARISVAARRTLRRNGVPGAIVGVWQPGRAPYVRAFGVRNRASRAPMRPGLYVRIGSETKTFTGTAILQLVDQGKVGLEDPVSMYVDGVPGGDEITIRELGEMRSGLVSYTTDETWVERFLADPRRQWTPREVLGYGLSQPPLFPPDGGFNYSNTNTVLLGLVVERVSGEPLRRYIARHILRPAGMRHTRLPVDATFPRPHARGYTRQGSGGGLVDATDWNPSWAWAAGAMISNLRDLRIWARTVATGTLLSRRTQRQRERFKAAPGVQGGRYGFALFDVGGWIGHDGSLPGYESLTVHLPSRRTTMVILLNTDSGTTHTEPSLLFGKAISRVVTPRHVFNLRLGGTG